MQMGWVSLKINMNYKTGREKCPKKNHSVPNEIVWNFFFFFNLGSIFPSTLLLSFNLFPIYLQRWHFQSFGDLGNSSGETTEARTDGKQWYKMCIGIFQPARGQWGCWWEIILACFKDALPPLLDRFKCGNTSEWKTPWASESEWLRLECWKCHVLAMCP